MKFQPHHFTLALVGSVIIATVFPCHGIGKTIFDYITTAAIALLFFFHGAKLSREAIITGVTHWKLHLLVFLSTFVLFPVYGLLLQPFLEPLVTPNLYTGILFVCVLPSTVQSSIALTSMARGNIAAAVCSATISNIVGMLVTPLLVKVVIVKHRDGSSGFSGIIDILFQLLLPFILGQIARRWMATWIDSKKSILTVIDQFWILLVVYTTFSAAVIKGLWTETPVMSLFGLVLVNGVLLFLVLLSTCILSRIFGFDKADEVTIVFCGSKKSLASGVPMANVLLSESTKGASVLPLMLFHQLQLMVCALLAQNYAKRTEDNHPDDHTD